ncbi:hypothetical protein [Fluoribacter gormanii]|uniref:hypothetical protein n=1 Tax=Fluoribacter gormanii TaxID=464 RepID=UPI0010410970|nr:hypothetical protein [Fluoribacter gormanii]
MPHPLYEMLKSIILDDRLIYDEQYASEKLPCGLTKLQFAGLLLLAEYDLPHKQKQDFKIDLEVFHKRRSKIISHYINDVIGNLDLNELAGNLAQVLFRGTELDLSKELMLNKSNRVHQELAEHLREQLILLKEFTYLSRHHQHWQRIQEKISANGQSFEDHRLSLSEYSHVMNASKASAYLQNVDEMMDAAARFSSNVYYSPEEQFVLNLYRISVNFRTYQLRLEEDLRREVANKRDPLLYVAIMRYQRDPNRSEEPLLNSSVGNTIKRISGGMHASVFTDLGGDELREVHILRSGPVSDPTNVGSIARNDVFELDIMAMVSESMKERLKARYGPQWQIAVEMKFREIQQNVYADAVVKYAHVRAIEPKSYKQLRYGITGHLFGRNTLFANTTLKNEELRAQKLYNGENSEQKTEMLCSEFVCLTLNAVFCQLNKCLQDELATNSVVVKPLLPKTEITDYVTPARLIELITQSGCAKKVSLSATVDTHFKFDGGSSHAPG